MRKAAKSKQTAEIRKPEEREISAEEAAALPVGSRVNMHGDDSGGVHRVIACTVAGRPGHAFLTYRMLGEIKSCKIRDYPGKTFKKVI